MKSSGAYQFVIFDRPKKVKKVTKRKAIYNEFSNNKQRAIQKVRNILLNMIPGDGVQGAVFREGTNELIYQAQRKGSRIVVDHR